MEHTEREVAVYLQYIYIYRLLQNESSNCEKEIVFES